MSTANIFLCTISCPHYTHYASFHQQLILNDLVRYFESPDPESFDALLFHPWGNVVGLFVFPFLVSLFQTRSQVILNHCAIFIRTATSTLLFSKALTISAAGRAQTSTGQVVNMVRRYKFQCTAHCFFTTTDRLISQFYSPNSTTDVKRYTTTPTVFAILWFHSGRAYTNHYRLDPHISPSG